MSRFGFQFARCILPAIGLWAGWPLQAAESKPVLAHYMPWYVARPFSPSWGWHWTMNHFNPENVGADGRREIAAKLYPVIGPYDSLDPAVLEYHCLLMKLAGIDGVIVDWYGQDEVYDYGLLNRRTLALLGQAQRVGLSFALCYEDRTIQAEIDAGFIASSNAMARAQDTLRYAQSNFFVSPTYLRLQGRPVLLNFGPQFFKSNSQWVTLFSVLDATNQPAFFTEDTRLPVGQGAFNWPPMWLTTSNGTLSSNALAGYLNNFQNTAAQWPAFISSAFPRFDDIYPEAGLGYGYGVVEDAQGATFRATLERALTNRSAAVQLVTWNDFGEGTVLEPTREFGTRDLAALQSLRRQHLDPSFPCRAADLELPLRLYMLRRELGAQAAAAAELDRAVTNLIQGKRVAAASQLEGLEARSPVLYDPQIDGGQLGFMVGGYGPIAGVEVQRATRLSSPDWVPLQSFPAGTNAIAVTTALPLSPGAVYFRARLAAGP